MRKAKCGSAAFIVGLTVVLSGCGSTADASHVQGLVKPVGLVPWIDSPSAIPKLPSPLPTTPPATEAPPCKASNLTLVGSAPSGLTGDHGIIVQLRNTGPAACLLSGTPKVIAKGAGLPNMSAIDRPMLSFGQKADTAPGKTAFVFVEASAACSRPGQDPTIYSTLDINYPQGGELVLKDLKLSEYCGIAVSPFYSVKPPPKYLNPPTLNLVPSLVLPATVKAGTTLTYEVDVSNPLNKAADLSPCPVYMEYSSFYTKLLYHLNCSSVRSIPPHGVVRYQMKMPIPADAPTGEASIHWVFFGPGNVGNGRVTVQ